MNKLELQKMANDIRKGIVTAVHSAKSGHPGGSLSAADIFTYPVSYTHLGFNGEAIATMEELQEKLEGCLPGDQVTLSVQRQNRQGEFTEQELATILGSKADIEQ